MRLGHGLASAMRAFGRGVQRLGVKLGLLKRTLGTGKSAAPRARVASRAGEAYEHKSILERRFESVQKSQAEAGEVSSSSLHVNMNYDYGLGGRAGLTVRARVMAEALIGEDGKLDGSKIEGLKKAVENQPSQSAAEDGHVLRMLEFLRGDSIQGTIEGIRVPSRQKGPASNLIRQTLKLPFGHQVTEADARRAALSTLLVGVRQGDTGSCFATSLAISMQAQDPAKMLSDIKSMIEDGCITRSAGSGRPEVKYAIAMDFQLSQMATLGRMSRLDFSKVSDEKPGKAGVVLDSFQSLGIPWEEAASILNEAAKSLAPKRSSEIGVRAVIKRAVEIHLGLSEGDVKDRERLPELKDRIYELSRKEPRDERAIDKLVDEYTAISGRLNKAGMGETFEKRAEMASFVENMVLGHRDNRLQRALEYTLAAPGRSSVDGGMAAPATFRSVISGKEKGLFSPKEKESLKGVDEVLRDILVENNEGSVKETVRHFTKKFKMLFAKNVQLGYRNGGFGIYDMQDVKNIDELTTLADFDEFRPNLARLVFDAGDEAGLAPEISQKLAQYVIDDPNFEKFYMKKRVYLCGKKQAAKDQSVSQLKKTFKREADGGSSKRLMEVHCGVTAAQVAEENNTVLDASDPAKLLSGIISSLRDVYKGKEGSLVEGKTIAVQCIDVHAFNLLPSKFADAIKSTDMSPQDWVQEHVIKNGETVVIADTNWTDTETGQRMYFAIKRNKRKKGCELVLVNESNQDKGGINPVGVMSGRSLSRKTWLEGKKWRLFTNPAVLEAGKTF